MATVAKSPRTKKRTAKETAGTQEVPRAYRGLTDAHSEAAIERFLMSRRNDGPTWARAIEKTGNRKAAIDELHRWLKYGWTHSGPGEPDLKSDGSCLQSRCGFPLCEAWHDISWDEVIDSAIVADAGVERWDPPSSEEPTADQVAAKQKAKLSTSGKLTMSDKIAAARLNGRVDANDVLTEHGAVAGDSEIAKAAKQTNGKPRRQPAAKSETKGTSDETEAPAETPPDRVVVLVDPAADAARAAVQLVPMNKIAPNPYQPRQNFDAAKIQELAKSIKTDGLLQPIVVRPKRGKPTAEDDLIKLGLLNPLPAELQPGRRFEIVDGERRLRAVMILAEHDPRFARIPVIVRETSDREMAKLALVANDQREDLDPIERAAQYQRMIREHGLTQDELGASLGHSQAYIANAIRLLELPDEWQARVISREMSPSHARELLRIAKFPKLLKCVARRLKEEAGAPSLAGWNDWLNDIVRDECRDLDRGARWDSKSGENVPLFKPTKEQFEQLHVIAARWYDGSEHSYCANTKLFDQLQATHAKEWLGKRLKNVKSAKEPKGGVNPTKKLTPAQLKAAAAKQARIFADRLARWKILWLRWLILKDLEANVAGHEVYGRLLIYFSAASDAYDWRASGRRERDLEKAFEGIEAAGKPQRARVKSWSPLECLDGFELATLERSLILAWFRFDPKSSDPPSTMFPDKGVAALADHLDIDVGNAWRSDLAGPLTEAYFNLHNKDQLAALGTELGVHVDEAKPKGVIVKQLLASPATKRKLPAELAPAKKGKGKK